MLDEAKRRTRIARYLRGCLIKLGITPEQALKDLRINQCCLGQLTGKTVPQLKVLHPLGAYVERKAKELGKTL